MIFINNDHNLNEISKLHNDLTNINNNDRNDKTKYDQDIINQLIAFEIGTKIEIMDAMDNVINRNDINEITEYLVSSREQEEYKDIEEQNQLHRETGIFYHFIYVNNKY